MKDLKTIDDFDARLKVYVRSTKTTMNAARSLAEFSILHFEKCGDLGPAQRFYDAMVKNYSRQPAFRVWIMAHAPVMQDETKKFKKDKSEDAKPFDVAEALKMPFWDFAPEMEPVNFSIEDITKAILATLKKFEGPKYHAENEGVVIELEAFKRRLGLEEAA